MKKHQKLSPLQIYYNITYIQESKKVRRIFYNLPKFFFIFYTMGHTTSSINDPTDDPTGQLKLNITIDKPVKQDLKQMLNWSLSEIREIYAPFRRRKGSPILTRSQFLRFIQLSRITSFYIYDSITKSQPINVFEILCILVMGAYTNYIYKLQFLFNVFDLRSKKKLSFYELILMFKSLVRGYCFLTGQVLPENQLLDKYGHAMFSKADLNNDQLLQIGDIVGWLETSTQNLFFFKFLQPTIYGKQDYHIFNSFVPYSHEQINTMLARINKIYLKQKLQQEDYLLLKPIIRVRKNQSAHKMSMSQTWGNRSFFKESSSNKQNSIPKYQNTLLNNSSCVMFKNNSSFLPSISPTNSKHLQKKKFENIIIIKGKSITKKQVFELRQYFDSMSVGKKYILIQDFIENFNQDKYNHMKSVAASLFNFLDKHQNGKIQFLDLVTKLYPNLSSKHLETISLWSDQYNRNFNMDKKIKANRNNDEIKKRVLPRTCITRLQQLYRFFDTQNKGYVNIQNLRQILGNACTEKEILQLFESSDADKDGKLTLKQFVRVLLPSDLEIEGLM